jgi:hypothetical protein
LAPAVFSGITDWCGMGILIAKLPWNTWRRLVLRNGARLILTFEPSPCEEWRVHIRSGCAALLDKQWRRGFLPLEIELRGLPHH